jgi:hypothetical protein
MPRFVITPSTSTELGLGQAISTPEEITPSNTKGLRELERWTSYLDLNLEMIPIAAPNPFGHYFQGRETEQSDLDFQRYGLLP